MKKLDDIWPSASRIEIAKGRHIEMSIGKPLEDRVHSWDAAIEWIKRYLEQASEHAKQMGDKKE